MPLSENDRKSLVHAFAEIGAIASASATPNGIGGLAVARAVAAVISDYAYAIEDGCVENLDYESHKRGTNWIATVTPNRAAPGGLDRVFWKHGSGAWYKAPEIKAGDVIEMAGDYTSARGNRTRDRRYVLVVRVEDGYFLGEHLGRAAPSSRAVTSARVEHGIAA